MESQLPPLVYDVVAEWLKIDAYFAEARCAEDDDSLYKIALRLSEVEHSLEVVFCALMNDRAHIFSLFASGLNVSCECHKNNTHSKDNDVVMLLDDATTARNDKCGGCFACVDKTESWLPPCYRFLCGDLSYVSTDGVCLDVEGLQAPIKKNFLISLCQFAKHNSPAGSRQIILCFLARLLSYADLPQSPHMGDPARSLLQIFPSSIVVSLVDMLFQIGAGFLIKKNGNEKEASEGFLGFVSIQADPDAQDDELEAFLTLLCVVAEKVEQVPSLAAFFLHAAVVDIEEEHLESMTEMQTPFAVRNSFNLLLELITHVALSQSLVQSAKRNSICRLALRGILSLAKCPDTAIQDYVKKHSMVPTLTFTEVRAVLLTVCKVPCNDDADTQLIYLCDVLFFWLQLLLLAPAVAEAWQVEQIVKNMFVRDTLVPLFFLMDDSVYSAAALVTARTLHAVGRAHPLYVSAVARALLGTRVDPMTGRPAQLPAGHSMLTYSTVTFLDYVLLPHLLVRLGGDWRDMIATLYLLQTLALYEPVLFMEVAFSLTISSFSEVLIEAPGHKDAGEQPYSTPVNCDDAASANAIVFASSPVSETARHVDCFQKLGFDIDLSAAATSPPLDVLECFPERLRAPKGSMLWISEDRIAEEVLARLLFVESHVTVSFIERRQCIINRHCRDDVCEKLTDMLAEDGRCVNAFQEPLSSFTDSEGDSTKKNRDNIWFSTGVYRSLLIKRLCELTLQMLSIPSEVSAFLTQLWTTICVLPDFRVLYTLMDPKCGCLREALLNLRKTIEEEFNRDEDVAFAIASKAAAIATGNAKVAAVARRNLACINEGACDDTTHPVPYLYTRSYLYAEFLKRGWSLRWLTDVTERDFTSDCLLASLVKHRVFLEAYAVLEAFRIELSAAVGHMALSHNLMCLQPAGG